MPLVKVCGVKTPEIATLAANQGADLIGMIFVPGRSRTVDFKSAKAIVDALHQIQTERKDSPFEILGSKKPLAVGVFQNQPLEEILRIKNEVGLDIVQLHGNEPNEWASLIDVPVIKRFTPGTPAFETVGSFKDGIILIDGEVGGDGTLVNWEAAADLERGYILAGGLTCENVLSALSQPNCRGVDVSGGVEVDGKKDPETVRRFVSLAQKNI